MIDSDYKYHNLSNFSLDIFKEAIEDYYLNNTNMKKKVYQYMVILHEYENPTGSETSSIPKYKDSKIIIGLTTTLASSEKELVFRVTREIPEEYASNPDNVEILIRPF